MSDEGADAFIFITAIIGVIFAWFQYKLVAKVSLTGGSNTLSNSGLDTSKLIVIYDAIRDGADSFLRAEYTICAYFIAAFGIVVLLMTSYVEKEFTSTRAASPQFPSWRAASPPSSLVSSA